MNILQKKVSLYSQYSAKTNKVVTLGEFLFNETTRKAVDAIRRIEDKAARDNLKKKLPCATISGIFNGGHSAGNLIEHSGLICIDIDQKENPHINDWQYLKKQLSAIKYVAFAGLSVSGRGVFVIIQIPPCDAARHKEYYLALEEAFSKCGVTIDRNCKEVNRLRGASYDDNYHYNPDAELFTKLPPKPQPTPTAKMLCKSTNDHKNTIGKVEACIKQIILNGIDLTKNYEDWLKLGFSLASLGEQGRQFYHAISQLYCNYSERETDYKFTELLHKRNGSITIGTFFEICKQWGVMPTPSTIRVQSPSPKPSTPPTPPPTETTPSTNTPSPTDNKQEATEVVTAYSPAHRLQMMMAESEAIKELVTALCPVEVEDDFEPL